MQAENYISILIISSHSSPVYSAVTDKLSQQPFINRTKQGFMISLKPRSPQEEIWMQWRAVCIRWDTSTSSPLLSHYLRQQESKAQWQEKLSTERVLRHCNRLGREVVKSPSLKAFRKHTNVVLRDQMWCLETWISDGLCSVGQGLGLFSELFSNLTNFMILCS